MKRLTKFQGPIGAWMVVAIGLSLMQCSFMPKKLKVFYKLPLPDVTEQVYEKEGAKIAYVRTGNSQGVPVVFIHGTPGSWEDWKLVIMRPELQNRFNLVAVNRPGWGRSPDRSLNVPKLSQQAHLLAPVLDAAGKGEKVILVGHSFGGPVAVRMALDYPEKVAAIILLAPILDMEQGVVRWYNHLADWALVKWFLPDILELANDEMLALPEELPALGRQMASLRLPVMLVHGLEDSLVDPDNAVFARHKWADTAYRETLLANFGHLIPQLRPGEVVLAILSASERIRPL